MNTPIPYQNPKKVLNDIVENLAPSIDHFLDSVQKQRYGFIVYIVDFRNGLAQHISSLSRDEQIKTVRAWLARQEEINVIVEKGQDVTDIVDPNVDNSNK